MSLSDYQSFIAHIILDCRSEAQALLQRECTAEEAALQLGPYCGMVVITDGANGSCISAMGRLQVLPLSLPSTHWVRHLFTCPGLIMRPIGPTRERR